MMMEIPQHHEHNNTPESSPSSSDSEGSFLEPETMLRSVNEPDVSLDEMLSLACRQGKLDIVQLLLQSGAHVNHRNKAGNTPLLEACSQGHVLVANYLLENGSKIDTPTETTLDSALTWACTLGNSIIVDALLHKNADVEHRTKDGCTALMFACLAGHRDVAEKLLDAKSEVNVESDSNKDSPLTFACWKGHHDVVSLLLERNANIEHRTKEGFSPLMFAALGGHTKVARKLLQCNAQVNVSSGSNNDIPLTSACWKGHSDVVGLLLEFNSNIEHRTKDGCTPLMLAAREGHIHVAQLLLKNHAQVNVPSGSENNIPLTLACWKGHSEVVRLLLEFGSNIEHRNKAGCTPLMLAAREGHLKTTALLLSNGALVNVPSGSNDDTPLTLACWKGHKDVVLLLLQSQSNIDHQTKTGCTPLMEATREGHRDVAEILLNHNANVELPDNYGQSPLFMACWKGHKDVAELLLQRNAYRDCRTKTGITPLFQACRENHVAIVEILIEYGASVNTPFPNSRENPMTLCAEKGHKILVELLLKKGAQLDCRTKKGCSPFFLACKEGFIEIAKILCEHEANMETADCRGNTPIMAAYRNGHVDVVEWLIDVVNHLPSDEVCHKILMSTVEEKDKEVIVQRRSKCLSIIQETKRKRELLALKNAQNLVQELDDEKCREEKKKSRKKEKRRVKRHNKKKNSGQSGEENETVLVNGETPIEDFEEDEEAKEHVLPTENRENDEYTTPSLATTEHLPKNIHTHALPINIDLATTKSAISKKPKQTFVNNVNNDKSRNEKKARTLAKMEDNKLDIELTDEKNAKINVVELLASQLKSTNLIGVNRELPRTTGVSTPITLTSQPSYTVTAQNSFVKIPKAETTVSATKSILSDSYVPIVSSIAATTPLSTTTFQSDPRTVASNITPMETISKEKCNGFVTDEKDNMSALLRAEIEYKESDWKEVQRTSKNMISELVVANIHCGRVIGKAGKKINAITDESGAQITIDKPPSNIVPANRVITIKGATNCVEKAISLVTNALNKPNSLTRPEWTSQDSCEGVTPYIPPSNESNPLPSVSTKPKTIAGTATQPHSDVKKSRQPSTRSIASADVSVTPLVTYTQVAAGAVSLESLQKQIQSEKTKSLESSDEKISSEELPDEQPENSVTSPKSSNQKASTDHSERNADFSYFSGGTNVLKGSSKSRNDEKPPMENHEDCVNNSRLTTTRGKDGSFDRGRSVSWTGNSSKRANRMPDPPSTRSQSIEVFEIGSQGASSPKYQVDDVGDEHVFTDENVWPVNDDVSSISTTERWDASSSPTSSVSSSKVELANILNDNDSGVGGSNPIGTPPGQSGTLIGYPDHGPFVETGLDGPAWLQARGAYSAPSSPALQRNGENATNRSSQHNAIRPQHSMENLNQNKGLINNSPRLPNYFPWNSQKNVPSPAFDNVVENSFENSRDSVVSSPHLLVRNPSSLSTRSGDEPPIIMSQTTSKPWSAERFQDVSTVTGLLNQLSLDKYAHKFTEKNLTLDRVVNFTEADLQRFDIPKGPRLKILKACDIIRSMNRKAGHSTNQWPTPSMDRTQLSHESTYQSHSMRFMDTSSPFSLSSQQQQQQYDVIPNNQFVYPNLQQSNQQQSFFTASDHFTHNQTNPLLHGHAVYANHTGFVNPSSGYVYPENPSACYFYSQP